jgi:hypothetical protein
MSATTAGAPAVLDAPGPAGLVSRQAVENDAAAVSVSDAVTIRTLVRFNAGTLTKNKGLAEARPPSYPTGLKTLRR